MTCDQNHNYTAEQKAYNMGLMDKFPEMLGVANTITVGIPPDTRKTACDYGHGPGLVMGYYDGNRQRLILDPDSGQPRDPDQPLAASRVGMAAPSRL